MNLSPLKIDADVPGVRPARQKRSQKLRDALIAAGIEMLNEKSLNDISISELTLACDGSVGSFYTRFDDKDAYFRALRSAAIGLCNQEIDIRLSDERLFDMSAEEGLDTLVDLMADLFTSPIRGVLRESLLRILEPEDPWAPMRDSAIDIMRRYRRAFAGDFPAFDREQTSNRLRFCFQLVVGALQNDLLNDYHIFTTKDESLRQELKNCLRSYMRVGLE